MVALYVTISEIFIKRLQLKKCVLLKWSSSWDVPFGQRGKNKLNLHRLRAFVRFYSDRIFFFHNFSCPTTYKDKQVSNRPHTTRNSERKTGRDRQTDRGADYWQNLQSLMQQLLQNNNRAYYIWSVLLK